MKKRVLHIAEAAGGVERYLVALLRALRDYPEFTHVLLCSDTYDTDKFEDLVERVIVVNSLHNAISPVADLRSIRTVRRWIRELKPDIVYCHSSKAGAVGRIADFGLGNRMVYNAHGWAFNMKGAAKKKTKLYALIEKMLAPGTDRIICISEYEKKSALDKGICREDRLKVIDNGIDLEEFAKLRPRSRAALGIPSNAFVVGTVGRLCRQKDPVTFVKMAARVARAVPEAYFVMVGDDTGDGKFRAETEREITSAGLKDRFLITGWVDEPLDYVGCFDIATLLSAWEGFGLVLPEYMLMGKPIVATDADAIPYVVGDAGLIVPVGNDRAAAAAVLRLRNEPELRKELFRHGQARAQRFDIRATAWSHAELFRELTGGARTDTYN